MPKLLQTVSLKGNIRKAWLQLFECFPFPSWLSLPQFSKQESLWFTFIYGTLWTTTKLKWEKPHLKTLWSATHSYCRREKWITPPPPPPLPHPRDDRVYLWHASHSGDGRWFEGDRRFCGEVRWQLHPISFNVLRCTHRDVNLATLYNLYKSQCF